MRVKIDPVSATELVVMGLVLAMVLAFAMFAAIGMAHVFGG